MPRTPARSTAPPPPEGRSSGRSTDPTVDRRAQCRHGDLVVIGVRAVTLDIGVVRHPLAIAIDPVNHDDVVTQVTEGGDAVTVVELAERASPVEGGAHVVPQGHATGP